MNAGNYRRPRACYVCNNVLEKCEVKDEVQLWCMSCRRVRYKAKARKRATSGV